MCLLVVLGYIVMMRLASRQRKRAESVDFVVSAGHRVVESKFCKFVVCCCKVNPDKQSGVHINHGLIFSTLLFNVGIKVRIYWQPKGLLADKLNSHFI